MVRYRVYYRYTHVQGPYNNVHGRTCILCRNLDAGDTICYQVRPVPDQHHPDIHPSEYVSFPTKIIARIVAKRLIEDIISANSTFNPVKIRFFKV